MYNINIWYSTDLYYDNKWIQVISSNVTCDNQSMDIIYDNQW